MFSSTVTVWSGLEAQCFSTESMILSVCLIKSLLLVTAFKEKCLLKVVQSFPEAWDNFEQIQICFTNLLHSPRILMPSFYTLLRQTRQTPKELSKFKTTLITFQPTFTSSKK